MTLVCLSLFLSGCGGPQKKPIWEEVKIGELAPRQDDKSQTEHLLNTINFDLHVFEMPAENIDKLDELRDILYTRPLRFNSLHAFNANSFSLYFGQVRMWDQVYSSLSAAGGKKLTKVSLMLANDIQETITITGIPSPRTIIFTSTYGSKEGASVGRGILGLRLKAKKTEGSRGVTDVVAYPVFSPPMVKSTISQLGSRAKNQEFLFSAVAFGLKMSPGDFILMAPEDYISDQTALGGLFFSNPAGSLFFDDAENKPIERKPAVRIFLLVCTGISD